MRELVFCCGIEGSEPEHAEALESLVLDVIQGVATQGVEQSRLEAVLHQLELHQREISGDGYPYGLQLILQALGCATHYSDPIAVLDLEPVIARLRQRIEDPNYIRRLAEQLLLQNPHRLTLVMSPDPDLSARRMRAESVRLAEIKAGMSAEQKAAVVQLAADLEARQLQEDDETILPKVELSDVPASVPDLDARDSSRSGSVITTYDQGTNGLVYQQLIAPLPAFNDDQIKLLPLYTNALTELGLANVDYLQVQQRQAATVGAINAFTTMRGNVDDEQTVDAYFVLSSKALLRHGREQCRLMRDTINSARFDETDRIGDLISQQRARREQGIPSNGHGLAMAAACAGMSPLAQLNHQLSGIAGIRALRTLDDSMKSDAGRSALADCLAQMHQQIQTMPAQWLGITEGLHTDELASVIAELDPSQGAMPAASSLQLASVRERCREIWLTNTQVNFCARAYPTVPIQHPDAAALTVLGGFLRNGFLHRAIREQGGAYGGGAGQDSGIAAFRFYSYRDPRLSDTLLDFDRAVAWMLDTAHPYRPLEEAILGVMGSLDKPGSPAGEAKQHFHNRLFGRTHAQREHFRQQVLTVTLDDLRRVTKTYLRPELASTAVIASNSDMATANEIASELELTVQTL